MSFMATSLNFNQTTLEYQHITYHFQINGQSDNLNSYMFWNHR